MYLATLAAVGAAYSNTRTVVDVPWLLIATVVIAPRWPPPRSA